MAITTNTPVTVDSLPSEILTKIFRNLLVMNENVTTKRPVLDEALAQADIHSMFDSSTEGATVHELKATQWFQDASQTEQQAGLWTEEKATSNIDTRFMRVNRRWAAVGRGILRREQNDNHFIEVATSVSMFSQFSFAVGDFGLKAWFVNKFSKRPDSVMKITIGRNPRFVDPEKPLEKSRKLLLRVEDANDFGRFLMLQSNTMAWKQLCIHVQIFRVDISGLCDANTAIHRLFQIPFASGLRHQILYNSIPPGTWIPPKIAKEKAKLNAYFRHSANERDVYSAGGALDHMLELYEQILDDTGDFRAAERILRETIQLAVTVLVTRFPKWGLSDGDRDVRHLGAESYLMQILRFSAYQLSDTHMFLAEYSSPSARSDHTLFAQQCMAYALGFQHWDDYERSAWRALCYVGMFQISLLRGKDNAAWETLTTFLELILAEDPELSLQIDQSARRDEAEAWCGLAKVWQAEYVRSAKDGPRKCEESKSFRTEFATDFLATQLTPLMERCWPEFEGVVTPRAEEFGHPF